MKILKQIRVNHCVPHQRLLSMRKLSARLKVPFPTVQRAVQSLVQKGYLYTRRGSGVYVNGRPRSTLALRAEDDAVGFDPTLFPFPHRSQEITIRFAAAAAPDERDMWRRVAEAFQAEFPPVRVDLRFDLSVSLSENLLPPAHLLVIPPIQLYRLRSRLMRLDGMEPSGECAGDPGLLDGVLDIGRIDGNLYGIPVLRSTSLICLNRDIFGQCNLPEDCLRTPLDIYRVGHAIEQTRGSNVFGAKYLGLFYYAALSGIRFTCDRREVRFDTEKLERLLEAVRPYIKEHHFTPTGAPTLQDLLAGRCGIFPSFSGIVPYLRGAGGRIAPVRIPLAAGGFVSAGAWVAGMLRTRAADEAENSRMFLWFLVSKKGQEVLCSHSPHWLSVRTDVLESQKANSPFSAGAILYAFDSRGFATQRDPRLFYAYGDLLNRETGKFFQGLQTIEKTIHNLKSLPGIRQAQSNHMH